MSFRAQRGIPTAWHGNGGGDSSEDLGMTHIVYGFTVR